MQTRNERVANLIKKLGAECLGRENNHTSLITVSRAEVSPDLKQAIIFFTVLPEEKETEALAFAKRKRSELRDLIKENMKTKVVPYLDVAIDQGEKHRQKIDELLRAK